MEAANCHAGGICEPMRSIMMMGAVKGNSEAAMDQHGVGVVDDQHDEAQS